LWPCVALAAALSSCAHRGPVLDPARTALYVRQIALYDHPLDVHFARPRQMLVLRPMLIYATGDGGFRGRDKELFDEMASFGYPVAGFSAQFPGARPSWRRPLTFISGAWQRGPLRGVVIYYL